MQTLTFSLGANAPAGATMTALGGQFTWQPSAAPGTNTISFIVTDNGVPSLSATQSFRVTVYLPPTLGVQVGANQMQLSWPRGVLQEADEAVGPYRDTTAISPVVLDLGETRKFYRIRL